MDKKQVIHELNNVQETLDGLGADLELSYLTSGRFTPRVDTMLKKIAACIDALREDG